MSIAVIPGPEEPIDNGTSTPSAPQFYPPPYVAPNDEDSLIVLNISGTNYNGRLTNNWSKRITRLNQLSVAIMRFLLRSLGGINFNVNITINLPNPFNIPGRPDFINVEGQGFEAIQRVLKIISEKVDNIHYDLPRIVPVASVVEHWQLKREALRPQGILLFGEWTPGETYIGSPKWQTCIPHFIPSRINSYSGSFGYWKGNRQGMVTLADNSKIIIYARDDNEIDRVFDRVLEDVEPDMKDGMYIKRGDYTGPPFSTRYVRLRRIDYYSTGQLKGPQDLYEWYPRRADGSGDV